MLIIPLKAGRGRYGPGRLTANVRIPLWATLHNSTDGSSTLFLRGGEGIQTCTTFMIQIHMTCAAVQEQSPWEGHIHVCVYVRLLEVPEARNLFYRSDLTDDHLWILNTIYGGPRFQKDEPTLAK